MTIKFEKAKREKIWAKILLAGPSGSGKSYTALRLATGIANKMEKPIAAIDTENGRIRYYANEFEFSDLQLSSPFTPESYIEAIDVAIDNGFGVIIIDSITHEWDYCLEIHNKMPGNSYTNWAKITPRHDAFMEKILQSQIHVICTVRGKDEYVMEEKNGKQVPKKVGLGYKQRGDTEYNYSVTFNIDQQSHVADAVKDNTHIFEGKYDMLTEKHGEMIYDWANSSKIEPKPAPKITPATPPPTITEASGVDAVIAQIDDIVETVKEKIGRDNLMATVKKHHTSANYKSLKDLEKATALLAELEEAIR
jgi:hypothetical protein